jgi:hypothetical protein
MMRKRILEPKDEPKEEMAVEPRVEGIDIPALATALVTSESPDHPIENAFDGRRGPGATRWVAASPGPQTLILEFGTPQTLRGVELEVEERDVVRSQELDLSVSVDAGASWRELLRQQYNFAPPGTTLEHESWSVAVDGLTHLRLRITPDRSGRPCRASLTALVLRGADDVV